MVARRKGTSTMNVRMVVGHSGGLLSPTVHAVKNDLGRETLCGDGLGYNGPGDQFTADPVTCPRCVEAVKPRRVV